MWVVKLGGSLSGSPTLLPWLRTLAAANVAIVPGGGEFADAVRRTQRRWPFDDATAHAMAILAMAQYGLMLKGLEPALEHASNPAAVRAILARGRSAIWIPNPDDIPVQPSWSITSDSLALWLAEQIQAKNVVLIKSAALPVAAARASTLMTAGIIDAAFESFLTSEKIRAWLCHRDHHAEFSDALNTPETGFVRIVTDGNMIAPDR